MNTFKLRCDSVPYYYLGANWHQRVCVRFLELIYNRCLPERIKMSIDSKPHKTKGWRKVRIATTTYGLLRVVIKTHRIPMLQEQIRFLSKNKMLKGFWVKVESLK